MNYSNIYIYIQNYRSEFWSGTSVLMFIIKYTYILYHYIISLHSCFSKLSNTRFLKCIAQLDPKYILYNREYIIQMRTVG